MQVRIVTVMEIIIIIMLGMSCKSKQCLIKA